MSETTSCSSKRQIQTGLTRENNKSTNPVLPGPLTLDLLADKKEENILTPEEKSRSQSPEIRNCVLDDVKIVIIFLNPPFSMPMFLNFLQLYIVLHIL